MSEVGSVGRFAKAPPKRPARNTTAYEAGTSTRKGETADGNQAQASE